MKHQHASTPAKGPQLLTPAQTAQVSGGGKPVALGGKPVALGGKPVAL